MFRLLSRMLPLIALNIVVVATGTPAFPEDGEQLYYVKSPLHSRVEASGCPTWDSFWIGDTEVIIVSASSGRKDLVASLGSSSGEIGALALGKELFIVSAPFGIESALLSSLGRVILSGEQIALVEIDPDFADAVAENQMQLKMVMPPAPAAHPPPRFSSAPRTLSWDARVQEIINQVSESDVGNMIGNLSGVSGVTIGGSSYTIQSRNSYQAVPIEKATQYCHEHLEGLGLTASYNTYVYDSCNLRNVVAEQTGTVAPDNIYIICGHLDDMPSGAVAPGADDNASGAAVVLLAASVLKNYQFENTIRYVIFTGEEQGLEGSYYYVQDLVGADENIRGALNFDMIAYDGNADNHIDVHCGTNASSGALGDLLISTISDYSISLSPEKITSGSATASDHSRFWDAGYPAILGIEDYHGGGDFNPYYHTVNDTRANCVLPYATRYIKAAVGALAQLGVLVPATSTPTETPTMSPTSTPTPTASAPAPPVITNISRDETSGEITISWTGSCDVDIYYAIDMRSAFTIAQNNVSGGVWVDDGTLTGGHPNSAGERYYRIACAGTSRYASDAVGMFRYLLAGADNLICLHLIPYNRTIEKVFGTQLTEGTVLTGDRIYTQYPDYGDLMRYAYLSSAYHSWKGTLERVPVVQGKGYLIQIGAGHTRLTQYIVGKVPSASVGMPQFAWGYNLIGSIWPFDLSFDASNLKESGANAGSALTGDRIYSQSLRDYGGSLDYGWLSSSDGVWHGALTGFRRGYGCWYEIQGGKNPFSWYNMKPYMEPPYGLDGKE
ncbi:MAG: M28 family peptidase [Candidatus Aureabacteria bacterium]|nr:M28 family peptidase [Candidatus Auribacterota bacterium]